MSVWAATEIRANPPKLWGKITPPSSAIIIDLISRSEGSFCTVSILGRVRKEGKEEGKEREGWRVVVVLVVVVEGWRVVVVMVVVVEGWRMVGVEGWTVVVVLVLVVVVVVVVLVVVVEVQLRVYMRQYTGEPHGVIRRAKSQGMP